LEEYAAHEMLVPVYELHETTSYKMVTLTVMVFLSSLL